VKTIIIVESDPLLRHLYELELSEEGYDIIPATTGSEALQILEMKAADLVITDIEKWDEGAAWQLSSLFHRLDCPVIINTGYPSELMGGVLIKKAAHVLKSSDMTKLKSQIKIMLAAAGSFRCSGPGMPNKLIRQLPHNQYQEARSYS
jgi:DNA-binding response OmpR family regulator